ncbi:MAG: guanylate kinase [Candidatus Gastranaerophilaceae bacterium]
MKKLIVISGSSGVGKGTIIKSFLEKHKDFKLSVSCTTRQKREGEVHGINYYYLTKEQFMDAVQKDEFLEWAEFSGNYYGTNKNFVQKSLDNNENIILEIDTQGAMQVREKIKNSVLIFILPPSMEELERRLRGRGTETEEAIQKRLNTVQSEMEKVKIFDYTVTNDTVDNAVKKIEEIIEHEQV